MRITHTHAPTHTFNHYCQFSSSVYFVENLISFSISFSVKYFVENLISFFISFFISFSVYFLREWKWKWHRLCVKKKHTWSELTIANGLISYGDMIIIHNHTYIHSFTHTHLPVQISPSKSKKSKQLSGISKGKITSQQLGRHTRYRNHSQWPCVKCYKKKS